MAIFLYYVAERGYQKLLVEPVKIDGEPHILKIRGAGCDASKKIEFDQLRTTPFLDSDTRPREQRLPKGSLLLDDAKKSARVTKQLNKRGIKNPLFVALYALPFYLKFFGEKRKKQLAIEVTATDSTMTADWFGKHLLPYREGRVDESGYLVGDWVHFNKPFFQLLNTDQTQYAQTFLENTLNSYHLLLELGYIHISPHRDNMPITGGLTNLDYVTSLRRMGFKKARFKTAYFISELYKALLKLQPIDEEFEKKYEKSIRSLHDKFINDEIDPPTYYNNMRLIDRDRSAYMEKRYQNAAEQLNEGISRKFGFNPNLKSKVDSEEIEKVAGRILKSYFK